MQWQRKDWEENGWIHKMATEEFPLLPINTLQLQKGIKSSVEASIEKYGCNEIFNCIFYSKKVK